MCRHRNCIIRNLCESNYELGDCADYTAAKLLQISGISAELQQINATGFDN